MIPSKKQPRLKSHPSREVLIYKFMYTDVKFHSCFCFTGKGNSHSYHATGTSTSYHGADKANIYHGIGKLSSYHATGKAHRYIIRSEVPK